jgi:myosin heavy subunit
MSNEQTNIAKIIIGVLVVALIGSWIYYSSSKNEIVNNYTTQLNTADSTKNAIQADFIAASAKVDSLTAQNGQLKGDLLEKSQNLQKLKSDISALLIKKDATDKELEEAKSLIANLNSKVSELFTDLTKAQEKNKQLNAKNQDLTNQNTTLASNLTITTKEKDKLQDIGSTLHASTFSIQALRIKEDGSEKNTKLARRANTLRVAFQIDKNRITPSGSKDLYICVTTPDGKSLGNGGTITTREDGNKSFSNKVSVQYVQNTLLPISYDVRTTNKFIDGEYNIEVYHNGFKIGEGKTNLKKGLL